MIDSAEQTGSLAEMFEHLGDIYEEDIKNSLISLTALIEPIMVILLEIVVGTVIIALFMPLVDLLKI